MPPEIALLNNYLIVGAMLFGIGLIGFLCRRNMIVMFLSAELMLQGISLSLIAWGRFHNDYGGQMLVVFIIAIAACEAAIALALIQTLFFRTETLDVAHWQQLREDSLPPPEESPIADEPPPPADWPRLTPAGVAPKIPAETQFRPRV